MNDAPARRGGAPIAAQFAGMGIVWGASFLFMKVALAGVTFFQVAWTRAILGAIVLVVVALLTRQRFPREPIVWLHFTVMAVVFIVIPHSLFAWAEQTVSSSLASIYNAVTPIMTAVFAVLLYRVERLAAVQIAGILVGILGVLVVIGPWQTGALAGSLPGQLACLGAVACYGLALGYQRRFIAKYQVPGITSATLNIGIAAAIFLILTPLIAWHPVRLDVGIVVSLVLLGAVGTGVAYIWNYAVLDAWGPTRTSTVTYVTPVVGIVLGVLILQERLSWYEPVGAALVLLGILLTQRRLRLPRRAAAPQ